MSARCRSASEVPHLRGFHRNTGVRGQTGKTDHEQPYHGEHEHAVGMSRSAKALVARVVMAQAKEKVRSSINRSGVTLSVP